MIEKQDFLFGLHPLIEAIRSGKEMDKILIKKGLAGELYHELMGLVRESGIPYQVVPVEKLNRLTRKNHQGVVGFVSLVSYSPVDEVIQRAFEAGESPLVMMLDGITDVRNFGAIARSAEVAGAHALIIPEKGGAQINADAVKTSAGALLNIPVCRVRSLGDTAKSLQRSGLRIVGASEKAEKLYHETDLSGPLAIVMGSEDTGISIEILKFCDELIKIPQHGKIESLNVSAASAVLIFEAVKQRYQQG